MNVSTRERPHPGFADIEEAAAQVAAVDRQCTRYETPCGDGHIVWRRWGAGSPVVLVHGGAGSWSHWLRNIPALSARHTVWALDLPGFGESAVPAEHSMEAMAAAVERGLDMLLPGGEPVDIAAFSFGSAIATMMAARMNNRLRNLALLGARFVLYSQRVNLHLVAWKKIADPAERLAAHRSNVEIMMMADPRNVDALAVYLQSTNAERARVSARRWKPGPGEKLHEYFPQVRAQGQIAVIFGSEDKGSQTIIGNRGAALLADRPDVKFTIVDHAGHWVQYEAAGRINDMLLEIFSAGA